MTDAAPRILPPDQLAREQALDAANSVLVQAPAGSGKTDLLTRRFLRLLAQVDEPGRILAITFTNAAAAEMRHRIQGELEKAAARAEQEAEAEPGEFSMETLAAQALARSQAMSWNLIDLPAQLRISTIDAFCRELALQQPLLTGLGSGLDIFDDPEALYLRAARRTIEKIDSPDMELGDAIERLLLLRDNSWQELEQLLGKMLAQRDKWMHGFVFRSEQDWDALRARLESPFARAVREHLLKLSALLDLVPHARAEVMELARFACCQSAGVLHRELAELAEFPRAPFDNLDRLEEARQACSCLAGLLLTTTDSSFRKQINVTLGFPPTAKKEKARVATLIEDLRSVPGLESTLAAIRGLPPLRYSQDDWQIVRASFTLLRRAAAELKVVFAEAGAVDYTEIAQIAQNVLHSDDGNPTEGALTAADGIRHLLVDEFQDTSRKQHELLTQLIAAWSEREERTCFVVGDPMQSIYSFRDADVELFSRVKETGLEIPHDQPLEFNSVNLTANFRTAAPLIERLNEIFGRVFSEHDGSGVDFAPAAPARGAQAGLHLIGEQSPRFSLHPQFMQAAQRGGDSMALEMKKQAQDEALTRETDEIVALIRSQKQRMEAARAEGRSYRIAVLGRARTALVPVAEALRAAQIPFRAVELEALKDRPEILDALALLRALLNPLDRVAWLGVLRAPWCGLSLRDLHTLVSCDDSELKARPVPDLVREREQLVSSHASHALRRVLSAVEFASAERSARPAQAMGTWLEQAWLRLGGADCVDSTAQANLDLLWSCLDSLAEGERDALGPALDAALDKLTASPNPDSDAACGVQLMTIHKAKGLEFEIVVVPELQAKTARTSRSLLSWLERGLTEPDGSGEIAEFLIAPMASRGADSGLAKKWVDRICAEREKQEMRRILYVAATRAREELHLFARLTCKTQANGSLALVEPKNSLLATAWPAIAGQTQQQFEAWQSAREPGLIGSIAASEADNLIEMKPATNPIVAPAVLYRLPGDYELPANFKQRMETAAETAAISPAGRLYERHEGSLPSRALGAAVHALLQQLARLRETADWDAARAALAKMEARTASEIRALGIERAQALRIASDALQIALNASRDPLGRWILSPHAEAASEARWTGVAAGALRTVEVDRLFQAGPTPLSQAAGTWWIVDYKTATAAQQDTDQAAENGLAAFRHLFAPQVEAYARILRNLRGSEIEIHAGLYYPRMLKFDWWEV